MEGMRRTKIVIIALVIVSFGTLALKSPSGDNYFAIIKNLDIFATLYKEVNAYYVDDVNPNKLIKTGIDAMLGSLDPYTNYIPEDQIENYRTMTTGEYGGIGAVVQRVDGVNTVLMAYEGYPAHEAGLKIGDQILAISGISLDDKSSEEISTLLKGQSKSGIELTVKRYNTPDTFIVTVSREKITIKNVPYYGMVDNEIGYIKLTDFTTKAGQEVKKAVKDLKADGAKKIILDLRGNPGGLLQEAVNISNVFIPKGKEVVTTRGKYQSKDEIYRTLDEPVDTEIPVAVLTSSMSASASEIVAGTIQDYDRGILVGRKTYGKGLVQITRPLSYNSQLKVTTAKYYIPSGRCIQAIDYSHRNADGSVGKIPDSLKVAFRTIGGREVFDGGGVDPDIKVAPKEYAPIAISLAENNLLFHYATKYYYEHKDFGDPRDFSLSDTDYQNFIDWLQDKDYEYTTEVEKKLKNLIESSEDEDYFSQIEQPLKELLEKNNANKESDLKQYKDQISWLLEQEIASRYELQSGMIEVGFKSDKDVIEAITALNDEAKYKQLLNQQ